MRLEPLNMNTYQMFLFLKNLLDGQNSLFLFSIVLKQESEQFYQYCASQVCF